MFRRISIKVAHFLGDIIIIAISLWIASKLRPYLTFGRFIAPADARLSVIIYFMAMLVWTSVFSLTNVYNLSRNLRFGRAVNRLVIAHAMALLAFAGLLYFSFRETSRLQVLLFAAISLLLLILYRLVFRFLLHIFGTKRYGARRVLIVGSNSAGRDIGNTIIESSWTGLQLVGYVDDNPNPTIMNCKYLGDLDQTIDVVQQERINEVIFTLPRHAHIQMANIVANLHALRINVRIVPDFFDLVFLRTVVEDLGDMPIITLKEPVLDPLQRFIKRGFDIIVAGICFILSLPVMAIIAVGIKLDSSGPILFTQSRIGEQGRIFQMLKFRTMHYDPDIRQDDYQQKIIGGQPIYKFYDDPRVTRFGHFLRKSSLDELPQFINILKGDMSLVGPRPELPWLVEKYEPWQRKRFEVPQGLTGWWQINGRADKPMHLNTQDDLYYIRNYSLWLDVVILWRTLGAVFNRRGSF